MRLRVRKEMAPSVASVSAQPVALPSPVVPPKAEAAAPAPPPAAAPAHYRELLSPMAGIFYRAPTPRAEPFVKSGDHVEVGQTVGLVEAMKTFNEVVAELSGRIIEFCVEDAEPVQRGQRIMVLEPTEVEV